MGDLFLLGERRIAPFFPLAHGVPRVDERRVVRGIVGVIRNRCDGKMHRRVAAEAKMVARATRSKRNRPLMAAVDNQAALSVAAVSGFQFQGRSSSRRLIL